MSKRTASSPHGSLAAGAVTALSLAVQTGLAAVVGVIIAREFGRNAETDGFFAAYGVFVTLALAATAIRVTVLPRFARARSDGRLTAEVIGYGTSLSLVAAPVIVMAVLARDPIAALLTGFGPHEARASAAATLPWMMVGAAGQLVAGILASAFAALDDYLVPAAAFITGSAAGLVLILLRVDEDGIVAVAWGVSLNAVLAAMIPAVVLASRARRERMPATALRVSPGQTGHRLRQLASGTAVPLGLQAVYLICLPLAAREGPGAVTSFGYGFLLGSAVVSVTASSLGLVTSVPLSRIGLGAAAVARHVVASSWIALLALGATGGVFATGGGSLVGPILGSGYDADVGRELGRVVVALLPWMIATVGMAVVFPLVFVDRLAPGLPAVAAVTVLIHVPLAFAGRAIAGLTGLALALALSTCIALGGMLRLLDATRETARSLVPAVGTVGALALVSYLSAELVLDDLRAATMGTAVYVVLVALMRPAGLRAAWRYLHQLA